MSGETFNIYLAGVGGQGIGLLSEVLARAADAAGHRLRGCDTHGMAQRGGEVAGHLRLGPTMRSPFVPPHGAQLVLALERHEAHRAARGFLAPGGTLLWYDALWQPLPVRMGEEPPIEVTELEELCAALGAVCLKVPAQALPDVRMQNTLVLREVAVGHLIAGVGLPELGRGLGDLMEGTLLEANLALLRQGPLSAEALPGTDG
nr:2-oxoacid:acceptor oxidoreductase family protein [uncultured Holophaga sp.]